MSEESSHAIDTLMQHAYEQLTESRFEEAVETFSASLMVGPGEVKALRGRGLAYMRLERWALAAADFRTASGTPPDDLDAWVNLGMCLGMDDQAYPAIEVFETVLAQHPTCARAHVELGVLYLRLGAIAKGRQHLERALTCQPSLSDRRRVHAMLHEQGQLDRKRLYRPDFEALHRRHQAVPGVGKRLRQWLSRLRGRFHGC